MSAFGGTADIVGIEGPLLQLIRKMAKAYQLSRLMGLGASLHLATSNEVACIARRNRARNRVGIVTGRMRRWRPPNITAKNARKGP